jgi:hypothetical protein
MPVLKRIGVLSSAKIMGALCLIVGLLVALLAAASMAVVGSMVSSLGLGSAGIPVPMMGFGIVSLVLVVIGCAIGGFIYGAIVAIIYNVIAEFVGGIEIDLQ